MAIRIANGNGNFFTSAPWDQVANTASLHASTNVNITTAGVGSTTFTAPNTTNAVTGVAVYMVTPPSGGNNWTAELYVSGVASGNIATINNADFPPDGGWVYFRLASAVTYSTIAANAYSWVFKSSSTNSGVVAADSGGTLVSILSTDDRHTTPSSSDQVWIMPHNASSTTITITVTGTLSDVRGTGGLVTGRSVSFGCYVGGSATLNAAVLKFDTAATSTLSVAGQVGVFSGGRLEMGTSASPQPSSTIATLTIRQTGTGSSPFGVIQIGTGTVSMYGRTLTYYKTTLSSGIGTTGSPLITADPVDWTVGDRIAFTPTSNNATNYNETEYKFIRVKNSSTSYTLANTAGGAESGLSNTHDAGSPILNLTRNVVFTNNNGGTHNRFYVTSTTADAVDIQWASLVNMGSSNSVDMVTTATTFYEFGALVLQSGVLANLNYNVFDAPRAWGCFFRGSNTKTYTGNIFCNSISNTFSGVAALGVEGANITFADHYFLGNSRPAIEYRGINCTFSGCYIAGNATAAAVANEGGINLTSGSIGTFSTCDIHANRTFGIGCNLTSKIEFRDCNIGTKGINPVDFYVQTNTANNVLVRNSNMGGTATVGNYLNGSDNATLIAFDKFNQTANDHRWWTEGGSARSTGAGLGDTTVRASGTLNIRIAPEDATTGFKWEYKTLAVPGKSVQSYLFVRKNTAFSTDDVTVDLFLPGSTTPDATANVSDVLNVYNVYAVAANYSGTESRYATVRVTAKTVTSAAYIYLADAFNGTNEITNFNTWNDGLPSPIMFEQLGDAGAVWAYLLEGTYNAGDLTKIMAAVLAGKVSGAGTGTETFRDVNDTKNRVVSTVDGSGNRTAITLDAT